MNIMEISKTIGLSPYTLRYYEKINLISIKKNLKGHRVYSQRDLKWLKFIIRLKESEMPIKEIQKFASTRHTCGSNDCDRLQVLQSHRMRLDKKRKEILKALEKIDNEIKTFKNWNNLE